MMDDRNIVLNLGKIGEMKPRLIMLSGVRGGIVVKE
jgi:hypothetical protein